MRLYVDADNLTLIRAENDLSRVTQIEQKRGDSAAMEIIFIRSGARIEHAAGTVVKFAAKEEGKFDADVVVFEDGFTLTNSGASPYYLGSPSFNTVDLDALLNKDADETNDKAFVDLIGEISWGIPVDNAPTSTRTFRVRVHNDVIRDDEGAPDDLPAPDAFVAARAILFDRAQSLSAAEKTQALENLGLPGKNNYAATAAPTVADDSSAGYGVGSLWIDVTNDEAYRLIDATEGAAVWIESTLDATEVATIIEGKADKNYLTANSLAETDFASAYPHGISYMHVDQDDAWERWRAGAGTVLTAGQSATVVTERMPDGNDGFTGRQSVYLSDTNSGSPVDTLIGQRTGGEDYWTAWDVPAKKSELETLEPGDIGAETPAGAQEKVDAEETARIAVETTKDTINPNALQYILNSMRELANPELSGRTHVGMVHKGDSIGAVPSVIISELQHIHGCGGLPSPNLGGGYNGYGWAFTSGAYEANDPTNRTSVSSYQYFSGASHMVMPVGATAVASLPRNISMLSTSNRTDGSHADDFIGTNPFRGCTKIRFMYLNTDGGGTVEFKIEQDNLPDVTTSVDTDNVTESFEQVELTIASPDSPWTVTITNSVAESIVVGYVALKPKGIIQWSSAVGGTKMELWANSYVSGELSQFDKDLFAAMHTDLCIYLQRAGDADDAETGFAELFDAMATHPMSHLVLGEFPDTSVANSVTLGLNALLRAEAEERRYAYIDLLQACQGDQTISTALGWHTADTIHLDWSAYAVLAKPVLEAIGYLRIPLGNRSNFVTPLMSQKIELLRLASTGGLGVDVDFRAGYTWDNETTTGTGTSAAFDNSSGLKLAGGTAIGTITGNVTNLCLHNNKIPTDAGDIAISVGSYRGISCPEKWRLVITCGGGTGVDVKASDLAASGFGCEFARGADIGLVSGKEYIRQFVHDGTTLRYGPWFVASFTTGGMNGDMMSLGFLWEKDIEKLTLFAGQGQGETFAISSMIVPEFATTAVSGHQMKASMWADETPATAAYLRIKSVKARMLKQNSYNVTPFGSY